MNKEEKIQEYENKQLINELSKMPPMVIATAYLHAINYTRYGVDVTEKWTTATQNASALEKAYGNGYYDAWKRRAESEGEVLDKIRSEIEALPRELPTDARNMVRRSRVLEIIDKYLAESEG